MTSTTETLPVEIGGTDITRFSALRHGVLSRFTVLCCGRSLPNWQACPHARLLVS